MDYFDYHKHSNDMQRKASAAYKKWAKQTKKKPKAVKRVKVPQHQWVKTHVEHQRWKKTDDYAKWKRKQFLKQGGTCYYCDQPLQGIKQNDEHVIPKSLGGDNRRSNLVLACWKCNKEKNSKLLSYKERQALKQKNRAKRGTYLKLKEQYKTDEEFGFELGQMFKV